MGKTCGACRRWSGVQGPGLGSGGDAAREVGAVAKRFVVVAAFLAAAAVPGFLAYSTGLLPGPTQASADSSAAIASVAHPVRPLAWPEEALGLAATDTAVLWEQRDPSAAVAGLWSFDVRTRRTERVLERSATGKSAGFPSASGDVIAWAAWAGRRGAGPPQIEAYDSASTRRWTAAPAGRDPSTAGDCVIWVEPDAGGGNDAIRGSNALTDEEYSITVDGRIRDVAAWGSWAVWIAGRGTSGAVWAGSYRNGPQRKLAAAGTAVAIDRHRILWAAPVGRHSSAVVSWDRHSSRSTVLCRVAGAVSSLSVSRRYAVWVTTRKATGPQVWAYDFGAGKAYAVGAGDGRQASPVIVAGSVYWADDRSGHWELYARSLQR